MTDLDLPDFDLGAEDLTGDTYHRRLAELRRQGWLARSALALVVLDRQGAEFFLRSRATEFPGRQIAALFGITTGPLFDQIDANLLNLSGEHHRRLRRIVTPAFAPAAANGWRPAMRRFLEELWEKHRTAASADLVEAVAKPYAALTIAAVLGAPTEDALRLHEWSKWVQRQFDVRALSSERSRIDDAVVEVYAYVDALLAERRSHPSDDLLSVLLAAESEGDRLSGTEVVNLAVNVLAGGIETTQSSLAHALHLFALRPAQWQRLADRPTLAPRAVEEVLRLEPVTPFTARICTDDLAYRGVTFPAGTIVALCVEQANREGAGADFDIAIRREDRSLTFGAGPHFCLGANLARAELEEALVFLAPRLAGLELDGSPSFTGIDGIYGLSELRVRWGSAAGS